MNQIRFLPRSDQDLTPLGNLPGWFSALLRGRGIRTEEEARRYLSPSQALLHDPFLLPGMSEIVRLLTEAMSRKETILVYGDYDADGICATSILLETLHELGASLAYRIPSRHSEGYGLNKTAIREMAEKCRLLITVDCGVSNVEEVALAKELGLTVIITDHHQPPQTLPPADVVMDPLLGDYPCPWLCGAGVALKICQALQGMEGVEKRLELAALATVADLVPLKDENRYIVREGLRHMAVTPRPGLRALMQSAGLGFPLQAEDLAFRLGPRLNAAGRLGDARLGVHLLLTPDPEKGERLARTLEEMNRSRQEQERTQTAQAIAQVEASASLPGAHVLLVAGENWNPGLIGLTAGRVCEKYHLPAVTLSIQGEFAVGSCRSIPGIHIYRMLQACSDLLERFGGHEQAAGLTVRTENLSLLQQRLEQAIAASAPAECFIPSAEYDLAVPFSTWSEEALSLLEQLEPTGCGNPAPLFLLQGAAVQSLRRVGRDLSHLKLLLLTEDQTLVDGIAFSRGEVADEGYTSLDLLYRPVRNAFRGRVSIEAQVYALHPC